MKPTLCYVSDREGRRRNASKGRIPNIEQHVSHEKSGRTSKLQLPNKTAIANFVNFTSGICRTVNLKMTLAIPFCQSSGEFLRSTTSQLRRYRWSAVWNTEPKCRIALTCQTFHLGGVCKCRLLYPTFRNGVCRPKTHHSDFPNFLFLEAPSNFLESFDSCLAISNCNLVFQSSSTKRKSISSKESCTLKLGGNPSKTSSVSWSASTFSSRGLQRNLRLKRALDKAEESCMLINISGHFVVERFVLRLSFAWLSVPPHKESATVRRVGASDNQPKACSAVKEARSSAEVEAHCDPPPHGLKR